MSISIVGSEDPSVCVIRTYPDHDAFSYVETRYGPLQVARLIADLSWRLALMHQFAGEEARRAEKMKGNRAS